MRTKLAIAAGMLITLLAAAARGQGTAFTYQGELKNVGAPANGAYDFEFRLYNTAVGGTQIGVQDLVDDVLVEGGLFSTVIDFGQSPFSGALRWLEIGVRAGDSTGGYQLLLPRQALTAVPYALHAAAPWTTMGTQIAYTNGNVGIGTTAPGLRLDVGGRARVRQDSPPTPDNTAGIWLYQGAPASDRAFIGLRNDTTVGIYGAGGGGWSVQMNTTTGNLGVGTGTPAAKLDVRGDIKLGPSGQYYAPAGGENLRIVRGVINHSGGIIAGSGFTATRLYTGAYEITFVPAFSGLPAITGAAEYDFGSDERFFQTNSVTSGVSEMIIGSSSGDLEDSAFHFIAIGPR